MWFIIASKKDIKTTCSTSLINQLEVGIAQILKRSVISRRLEGVSIFKSIQSRLFSENLQNSRNWHPLLRSRVKPKKVKLCKFLFQSLSPVRASILRKLMFTDKEELERLNLYNMSLITWDFASNSGLVFITLTWQRPKILTHLLSSSKGSRQRHWQQRKREKGLKRPN